MNLNHADASDAYTLEIENQILAQELEWERAEKWLAFLLCALLGVVALVLGWTHPSRMILWVVAGMFFLGLLALVFGGLVWAAKRGDEEMGIGDSQGR